MFSKILVPLDVDYSKTAAAVYRKAAELARCCGAEIRLITVVPGFGMPIVAAHIPEEVRKESGKLVREAMKQFIEEHCNKSVSYEIRTGKNWEEIIEAAEDWGADLIVVYHNRRSSINEAFSRSCAERVTDNAACSVLRLRNVMG
ncbi:MAG: universal stress protein [Desulfobacterales bacterium]|nr:universal stress protein [Desulfobacterales bacterium]MCF8079607.1 universal stress protein [Desulfobacterales bacterium]